MQVPARQGIVAVFCGLALCVASAQQASQGGLTSRKDTKNNARKVDRSLSPDDGMSVIAAALDAKVRRDSAHDCSHMVHAIYERAGFPYVYVTSYDLYDGVEGFRRVFYPQPGDIIVWHGHVGIVVQPSRHVFFSFLTAGPTTDNYYSPYWIGRGRPRFYRYIKNDPCAGCNSVSALHRGR
jgi:hypothetical protein